MGIVCAYLALTVVHIIQYDIINKGPIIIEIIKRSFTSMDSSRYVIFVIHS
jgi:hypothetical protein